MRLIYCVVFFVTFTQIETAKCTNSSFILGSFIQERRAFIADCKDADGERKRTFKTLKEALQTSSCSMLFYKTYTCDSLYLNGVGLVDIDPIKYFKKLKTLRLDHNVIEDLSGLSQLKNVKVLQLQHNHITNLSPLSDLSSLEHLNISDNPLSDMDKMSTCRNLAHLNIERTQISDLDKIRFLTNLKSLKAGKSDVNEHEAKIRSVEPLRYLEKIRFISLPFNEIEDIRFLRNIPKLHTLDISGNHINDLTQVLKMHALRTLRASHNSMTSLAGISKLKHLQELDLSFNKLNLDELSELVELKKLSYLVLKGIQLKDASSVARAKMSSLNVSDNLIDDMSCFDNHKHLRWLDVSHNKIVYFSKLGPHVTVHGEGKQDLHFIYDVGNVTYLNDDEQSPQDHEPGFLLDHTCSICLEDFEAGEKLSQLRFCSHNFHHECLDPWLKRMGTSPSCPNCRGAVSYRLAHE